MDILSIIQKILSLIFGDKNGEEEMQVNGKEEIYEKRPYVDSSSTKVGEVELSNPRFYSTNTLECSLSKGVHDLVVDSRAIVNGNVTFKIYCAMNANSINNPPMKTVSYNSYNPNKELRFEVPKYCRSVGKHTIVINQVCNTSRNDEGVRMYTTYASYSFDIVFTE